MDKKESQGVSPNNKALNQFGFAFDLGSTTIAGALVDLQSKLVVSSASLPNPQASLGSGADIISRIRAVSGEPALLLKLQEITISAMNEIMSTLCPPPGAEIRALSVAGNSVMEHILLNINPEPLGKVPYRPVFKEARSLLAMDLGLKHPALSAHAELYCFPLIGGFIGGDTVAMILSLGLRPGGSNELAIDIGTNSEIVLATDKALYCASAAAGPAFEGGAVEFGMNASKGAIRAVSVNSDDIKLEVVGGGAPRGICGSGLCDLISGLIRAKVVDRSGRLKDGLEIDTNLSTRIVAGKDGNSFVLYKGPGGVIRLSQTDLRSFQTAKGAIRAGVDILMLKAGIKTTDIDKVFLAGAFGSNLDKEGLETVGLLDVCWSNRTYSMGDAALDGAVKALITAGARKDCELTASNAKYVSLSGSPGFEREFIKNMNF